MRFTQCFSILKLMFVIISVQGDPNQPAYNSIYNKYCDLQYKNCNHSVHPLCSTFDPTPFSKEDYEFTDFKDDDIEFFVTTVNTFRNDLAVGKIYQQKPGANLRVVQWSDDFVRLLKAKELYSAVCTEISMSGQMIVELEEFNGEDEGGDNAYRLMFAERVLKDWMINSPWIEMYRAEFDKIGCVHFKSDGYERLACYVNRYRSNSTTIEMDKLYKYGEPCSNCDVGGCSLVWTNLCDEKVKQSVNVWEYYKIKIIISILIALLLLGLSVMKVVQYRSRNNKTKGIEMRQNTAQKT